MKESSKLIRVFTGSEVTVNLVKEELEKAGIPCFSQNDFKSGIAAGFAGGTPSAVDLFIREIDVMRAQLILREYERINRG
jgi:Putative prokaryotic signal transducing protein